MIDLRYIKKLIEMLDASTVDSVEISSDKGMKLRISKSPQGRGGVQMAAPVALSAASPTAAPAAVPAPVAPAGVSTADTAGATRADAKKVQMLEVKSPMVGTFYSAPEPGATPYVRPGTRINKGQVLCIIEAMKIMNEIESEVTGVVKEVLAQEAHPVEYGQVLFVIDPHE